MLKLSGLLLRRNMKMNNLSDKDLLDWLSQKSKITELYDRRANEFGNSHLAVCWGTENSQSTRFNALCQVDSLKEGVSILDVGCGLGDFYTYLKKYLKRFKYLGVDVSQEMIRAAQRTHTGSDAEFLCLDILTENINKQFDYVFASGLFNKLQSNQIYYMKMLIGKMFSFATNAISFNTLNAWSKESLHPEDFSIEPADIIEICRNFSPRMKLGMDYMLHDFTVHLYKR